MENYIFEANGTLYSLICQHDAIYVREQLGILFGGHIVSDQRAVLSP